MVLESSDILTYVPTEVGGIFPSVLVLARIELCFLPSSWYSAVFWIQYENDVDNKLMFLAVAR